MPYAYVVGTNAFAVVTPEILTFPSVSTVTLSAPPAPNPNELINAQANANRITQFTPQGNLLFGSVGDQGQFV